MTPAGIARDGARRLTAVRIGRPMGHDVDAVDVPILVTHQQRVAFETSARRLQMRLEIGAHQTPAQSDGELLAAAVCVLVNIERIQVRGICARRIHAVVFELCVPAQGDLRAGIDQRRVLALRHVLLDEHGARSGGSLHDDARVGNVIGSVAARDVQDDQGEGCARGDPDEQAVEKQRGVEQRPALLIRIRQGFQIASQ